jgi:hypothetical protein
MKADVISFFRDCYLNCGGATLLHVRAIVYQTAAGAMRAISQFVFPPTYPSVLRASALTARVYLQNSVFTNKVYLMPLIGII